jgi:hypothetical protein
MFRFAANALSTNNQNDYQLTAGAAVFRNNNGLTAFTVVGLPVPTNLQAPGATQAPPAIPGNSESNRGTRLQLRETSTCFPARSLKPPWTFA